MGILPADLHCDVLVLGAGLCGLSAAYHLEQSGNFDYLVLERNPEVGGLARTETFDGFSFDHAIHILYTNHSDIADLICNRLLPDNLHRQPRASYCFTAGTYTLYPYQANNYGLPADIVTSNILGLIEARYHEHAPGPPANFEEWIYRVFGRGIAEHFMIPYNRRVWAWDLSEMGYDWIAGRVPLPNIADVIRGALQPPTKSFGPAPEFWYPVEGGIEALAQALADCIPAQRLLLNTSVVAIDARRHQVTLADGRRIAYEQIISSLPMPLLVQMLGQDIPSEVRQAAATLKFNVVHTVSIGLEQENLGIPLPMHWTYFPEETTVFHRLSFPHRFAPSMVPPGCCSIQAEISESAYRPRDCSRLVEQTLDGLVHVGLLTPEEILPVKMGGRVRTAQVMTLNPAYIIYDLNHKMNTDVIKNYLHELDIETRGRFGEWEYFNMDHSMLSGRTAALGERRST